MNPVKTYTAVSSDIKASLPALRAKFETLIAQPEMKQIDAPVSDVCAQVLKSLFNAETVIHKTSIIERTTGKSVPAYITKFEKGPNCYLFIKDANGDKMGSAVLSKKGEPTFFCKKIADYLADAVELESINTINKGNRASDFKGIGTELLNAVVKESRKKGCNGKVYLMAMDAHPPTPFYFKYGFKFPTDEKNKMMEEFLALHAKDSSPPLPEAIQQGVMYLEV